MADIFIQNLRNPDQTITATVTIRRLINQDTTLGHGVWALQITTSQLTTDGSLIPPVIREVISYDDLTSVIGDMINEMSAQVPWDYLADSEPPIIGKHFPTDNDTNVSVETSIQIWISENIPSAGLDLSSIRVKVKGFDLTNQLLVEGDLKSCVVTVTPGTKYQSAV
jgi:hypothetical protein